MGGRHSGSGLGKGFFLLCIGCVLIAIGLSFGGRFTGFPMGRWFGNPPWTWNNDGFSFRWNDRGVNDDFAIRGVEILEASFPKPITRFDVRLRAASLVIKTGSVPGYRATDFEKDSLSVSIDNDRFTIEETDWQHSVNFGNDRLRPVLEITLNEDTILEDAKVSVGAGSVKIEGINTDRFGIESGAGSIKGTNIVAKKATLKTGAGSLEFDDCQFYDTEVDTGAGRVVFSGEMTNRAKVSTGAGSVDLRLKGSEDLYRVEYSRGIGSVRIGSSSYNGIGNGVAGNSKADRIIKISTGIGSVNISFDE